jgi:hypothetical protein
MALSVAPVAAAAFTRLEQSVKKLGFASSAWAISCRGNEMAGEEAAMKMSVRES